MGNRGSTSNKTLTANNEAILIQITASLEKYLPGAGKDVIIPRDEFLDIHRQLQMITSGSKEGLSNRPEKVGTSNKILTTVQLLNTSDTDAAKSFVDELQRKLVGCNINVEEVQDANSFDQRKFILLVGNTRNYEGAQQVVDRCLDSVKEDLYEKLILIILHVIGKDHLPITNARGQLISTDPSCKYNAVGSMLDMAYLNDEGIYKCKMNDLALQEIPRICLKSKSPTPVKSNTFPETKERQWQVFFGRAAHIVAPSPTDLASHFVKNLQAEMRKRGVVLIIVHKADTGSLNVDVPLVIVCNNTTRLETDVNNCLSVLSSKSYRKDRTVLVVLHVGSPDYLHVKYTREQLQATTHFGKYEAFLRIIDMSYNKEHGIYPCTMNGDAFEELKILKKLQ